MTAVFHPREGATAELVEAFQGVIPPIHEEDGCLLYSIHAADDGTITMIEKWATQEDLDAHSVGEPVARLREAIAPYLSSPAVVTAMTPIPVGDSRGEV
ncbi:MAG TPA: putative quinol monooxygenase [Thermomicrobiales bacterium]|nr:putative quinol monooxygenase [Thermomicrobiales bacterium]